MYSDKKDDYRNNSHILFFGVTFFTQTIKVIVLFVLIIFLVVASSEKLWKCPGD